MNRPTNYQRTAAWLRACGKSPGDNVTVQVGCMLEEVREFFMTVTTIDAPAMTALKQLTDALDLAGGLFKSSQVRIEIQDNLRAAALDALCDIEVTVNGVAYLSGFSKDGADEQVLGANDRKLVDGKPVILSGGKIGKPEGWRPPNLQPFV